MVSTLQCGASPEEVRKEKRMPTQNPQPTAQPANAPTTKEQGLVRFGLGLANWSERWFPDPLVFALLGIVVVFVVGLLLHQSPAKLAIQGGKNFWALVPFTMQMVMIIVGGYVVASTPIVYRFIRFPGRLRPRLEVVEGDVGKFT